MSLSVDQLRRLEFVLSTDLEHHKKSGITPGWKLSKIADELQAVRELLAIKEAEPVAFVCDHAAFVHIDWTTSPATQCSPFRDGDKVVQVLNSVPVGAQLIVKPE